MAIPEFELIRRYFSDAWQQAPVPELYLGPGDDAAILQMSPTDQLLVSVDTLNVDVHFLSDSPPERLAQRCLRVNISDLAAMGGEPVGFTLALSLPSVDEQWLAAFSQGLVEAARAAKCPLIGGDTTHGPLSITIQVLGKVPAGQAIQRSGANIGDLIYVTGTLGEAAAALPLMKESGNNQLPNHVVEVLLGAFYEPVMRVPAAVKLRNVASAGLDLSDGLISDLQHILTASSANSRSELGARINVAALPMSSAFKLACPDVQQQVMMAVSGGDDYQLCVTVPEDRATMAESLMSDASVPFTRIGEIVAGQGIQFLNKQGERVLIDAQGYQHFSENS